MLPIYAGLNRELELKAQEILRDIIGSYIEVYKDDEIDFSGLFPEEIYFARKDKCDKAVNEIYYWSRDSFRRDLSPLHEYALFKILEWAEEIEEDYKRETNKSLYFNELTKKVIDNDTDENEDWELSDLGHFNFYFECCFEDHGFLSVSSFFNMLDMFPIESIENQYGIDLKCYLDLVPPDIEKKINELSKDINRAVNEKEKKDFDVFLTHSSLDKEEYVSELSEKLEIKGLKVFEDVKVFKLGHSQTDMMNKGILNSKFVVVFLSPNFIKSSWSDYEFKSFLNREINEKKIIILPIWHNIQLEEVREYNPYLIDKFALDTQKYSIDEIVESIHQAVIDSEEDDK